MESKHIGTGGQDMGGKEIISKIVKIALLCLVIGSLLGGLVGVVMAGEIGV